MRLILDANISWRIIQIIGPHFETCVHVEQTPLKSQAKDADIWNYAREHDLMVVSNDDDFRNLINTRSFPPKLILLRTGNQSTRFIADILVKHKDEIERLYRASDYGLLEIH